VLLDDTRLNDMRLTIAGRNRPWRPVFGSAGTNNDPRTC